MFHSHLCYFFPPQGHLLLIGVSGAGKTTLSRFVAWMNGLKVFQVKVCLLRLEFFPVDSWFCFNSPCDWSRKLMPPFQPIRGNTETNWGLVARVFPRLRWFVFYHEFLLVPCDIFVCFDWPLRLPILLFLVSNYKLTLGPAESELTLMLCNLLVQWLPSDKCDGWGISFF